MTLDVEIKLLMQYKKQHTSNFRLDMDLAILLLPTLKSLQTADIPEMLMADYSSAFSQHLSVCLSVCLAVDTLNIFEKISGYAWQRRSGKRVVLPENWQGQPKKI